MELHIYLFMQVRVRVGQQTKTTRIKSTHGIIRRTNIIEFNHPATQITKPPLFPSVHLSYMTPSWDFQAQHYSAHYYHTPS